MASKDNQLQQVLVITLSIVGVAMAVGLYMVNSQRKEDAAAVGKMAHGHLGFLRAHRLYVEADETAGLRIASALEHANLIERHPQVGAAEGLVLIVLHGYNNYCFVSTT